MYIIYIKVHSNDICYHVITCIPLTIIIIFWATACDLSIASRKNASAIIFIKVGILELFGPNTKGWWFSMS